MFLLGDSGREQPQCQIISVLKLTQRWNVHLAEWSTMGLKDKCAKTSMVPECLQTYLGKLRLLQGHLTRRHFCLVILAQNDHSAKISLCWNINMSSEDPTMGLKGKCANIYSSKMSANLFGKIMVIRKPKIWCTEAWLVKCMRVAYLLRAKRDT